ncbi:MAG TPA: hypothetical protein VFJ23_03180 [Candidatus Nitrosotalea sp.]|nr:hypothetical protein [Candidatus Nitrosotalea sp.]
MRNSLPVSIRRSRIFLYIISNPFCTLKDIYENSWASANWKDVKSDLDYFVKSNFINNARWWSTQVYFVTQHLNSFDRITSNHLLLKDEIFSFMKSSEQIRNSIPYKEFVTYYKLGKNLVIPKGKIKKKIMHYRKKINTTEKPFEQILQKLVILYFLQLKILLLEYNKNKKIGCKYAMYRKDSRERQLIIFLHNFKGFLSEYGRQSYFNSRVYSSYEELSEHLDYIYNIEINYYNILSKHGLDTAELVKTSIQCSLETKKDVSQKLDRTMKQIGNRTKPIEKPNGEPDYEKMYLAEMIENASGITDEFPDIVELININNAKKIIKNMPKGTRRNKIIQETKILFPGINPDD